MNPLKPVRFYGISLPRPRFLEGGDQDRVCPPVAVNDSLLRWAKEANWAMGGLSYKKKRMQGKIEGRLSKLKNMEEDEDESPEKAGKKSKISPMKSSPDSASKKPSPKSMKRKGKAGVVKGRQRKGAAESPGIVTKRSMAIHPVMGEWGEEDGPSPRRTSPRLHATSPLKPVSQSSSPLAVSLPSPAVLSQSIEFPVQRGRVERALPDADDTESEVNWEEFSLRDRPLRKSSRVTSLRRSFKEFASASSDSDHEN